MEGWGATLSVNFYAGGGLTGSMSFDKDGISGWGASGGAGAEISSTLFASHSWVVPLGTFTTSGKSSFSPTQAGQLANNLYQVYTDSGLSSGQKNSIAQSMANTATSGKDIKWYKNAVTGRYTYRADGSKPKGDGWSKVGGTSGSSKSKSKSK